MRNFWINNQKDGELDLVLGLNIIDEENRNFAILTLKD